MTGTPMTPRQAAKELGLHEKTVRQMCATRRIGHTVTYGPKGQARYHLSPGDIAAWKYTHHVEPKAQR